MPYCVGRTESRTASLLILKSTSDDLSTMMVPKILWVVLHSHGMWQGQEYCRMWDNLHLERSVLCRVIALQGQCKFLLRLREAGLTACRRGVGQWISLLYIFDEFKAELMLHAVSLWYHLSFAYLKLQKWFTCHVNKAIVVKS